MEKSEIVVVLDAGKEGPAIGPEAFCCGMCFTFYRGL